MKRNLISCLALLTCVSNLWAYRDSVGNDDSGTGGLVFAAIIVGAFVIAFIVGIFRNLFK